MRFTVLLAAGIFSLCSSVNAADGNTKYTRKHGDWMVVVSSNQMTDEKICVAQYAKDSLVAYTSKDRFEIDYARRGGVDNFQYRFGKSHPSEIELLQAYENEGVKIPVLVAESLEQPKLLVQGATVLKAPINLEISLRGLKDARADMAEKCEMSDLRSIANGAPDWASWQATPATTPLKK